MVTKEFYSDQEAGNYDERTLLQDPYEEEEALSLCDLPIYSSDSSQWDDFSKEEGQHSPSNNNNGDDFFEFFSEEFTTTSTRATAENIIFCGKLIPTKEPPHVHQKGQNFESNTQHSNAQNGVLLPWRPNSFDKAKPTSKTVKSSDASFKKGQEAKGSKNFLCDYSSIGKVSLLRSTTKSRWYLFMFGMSRLSMSTEMELSDIRSRLSRRAPATMFPAPEHGGEVVKSKGRSNFKGLLRILRSLDLGCFGSKLTNDVVKAAFV